jgi:sulfur carrier protein
VSISVRINDELTVLDPGITVAGLIAERYADRRWLAVAVDGEVVPRSRWAERWLHEGAAVEILTAVQGG